MPDNQDLPSAHSDAGKRLDKLMRSAKSRQLFRMQVDRIHSLAIDPYDRFYTLFPEYERLCTEFGKELPVILAQVRSDLIRSIDEKLTWNWRAALDQSRSWEEYIGIRSQLLEESVRYLRSDQRILQLARGNEMKLRGLVRIQLLTFLEAARLPGVEWLAEEKAATDS